MKLRWPTLNELRVGIPIALPLFVLLIFVVRGCGSAEVPLVHPPEGFSFDSGATTLPNADLTGVQLAAVDGTTVPVSIRSSGTARLLGSVNGPQGPVPGATVRVEHLVDDVPPPVDLLTGPDGRWDLPNVAGGRYRLRAFLAPTLAQVEPEIFFLEDGTEQNLDLTVTQFQGIAVTAAISPDPPVRNQPTTLVVRVARRSVEPDGVVRGQPIASAAVALTGTQGWQVTGPTTGTTSATGDAAFTIECKNAGTTQLQVTVRATAADQPQAVTLELSACTDPNATTTSSSSSSSSSGPPPSSSSSSSPGPN